MTQVLGTSPTATDPAVQATNSNSASGSDTTTAFKGTNSVPNTGNTWTASSSTNSYRPTAYNAGAEINSNGTGTGVNIGARFMANNSSALNIGTFGTAGSNNSTVTNAGVVGVALNATNSCGGYFGLVDGTSPPAIPNAALVGDNGATTADIIQALDNGTAKWKIKDGGIMNFVTIPTSAAGLATGDVYSNGGVLTLA